MNWDLGKGKDAADLQVWHDSQMHGESDRPNVPAALLLLLTAVPLIFGMAGFDTGPELVELVEFPDDDKGARPAL